MWWPGIFQNMSRGHILVFSNRHCSTMNLVKEEQGGLVPPGFKRCPFKLIKHVADTTRVSPSPAGPAGCCPLNFLNLKFRVRAQNGAAYSSLGRTKVFYANYFFSNLFLQTILSGTILECQQGWIHIRTDILFCRSWYGTKLVCKDCQQYYSLA